MGLKSLEAHFLVCDEPGCNAQSWDVGAEVAFYASRDQAIDDWREWEGQYNPKTGEAWCPDHSEPQCVTCDEFAEVNEDLECADCAAVDKANEVES